MHGVPLGMNYLSLYDKGRPTSSYTYVTGMTGVTSKSGRSTKIANPPVWNGDGKDAIMFEV
jgi:hypothetical protein